MKTFPMFSKYKTYDVIGNNLERIGNIRKAKLGVGLGLDVGVVLPPATPKIFVGMERWEISVIQDGDSGGGTVSADSGGASLRCVVISVVVETC